MRDLIFLWRAEIYRNLYIKRCKAGSFFFIPRRNNQDGFVLIWLQFKGLITLALRWTGEIILWLFN